jgi:hypothetical protein
MTVLKSVPSRPNVEEKENATSYPSTSWHTAYMAAVSETDRLRLPARIRYAAQLILQREHELLQENADPNERRALNNALNALRTLQSYAHPKAG